MGIDVRQVRIAVLAMAMAMAMGAPAGGASERDRALDAGAVPLDAEGIADLLVGNTVTARSDKGTFRFYYGEDNDLVGKMVGGSWSDTGFYGISDENRVCLSISKDAGRLRCVTLLRHDGVVRKYDASGRMTFEIVKVEPGREL